MRIRLALAKYGPLPDSSSAILFALAWLNTASAVCPEAAFVRAALDIADTLVGLRQLELKVRIAPRLDGKPVQRFERCANHQFTRLDGAWQIADGIVDIVENGIRDVPHLVEAPPRAARL
jgi:hypothetical protein